PVQYADDNKTPITTGFIDLSIIEAPGNSTRITVDQTRYLQDAAGVRPVEGQYRVVLVFGADRITDSAANSVLKWLEEPPSYLHVILVSDNYFDVLETIRSRCATILCQPMEKMALTKRLIEEERVDPGQAEAAAALAEGRP